MKQKLGRPAILDVKRDRKLLGELLAASKMVMAWADCANVANNSQRCESIHNLRFVIAKAEEKN